MFERNNLNAPCLDDLWMMGLEPLDIDVATGSEPSSASEDSKREVIDDVDDEVEEVDERRERVAGCVAAVVSASSFENDVV